MGKCIQQSLGGTRVYKRPRKGEMPGHHAFALGTEAPVKRSLVVILKSAAFKKQYPQLNSNAKRLSVIAGFYMWVKGRAYTTSDTVAVLNIYMDAKSGIYSTSSSYSMGLCNGPQSR